MVDSTKDLFSISAGFEQSGLLDSSIGEGLQVPYEEVLRRDKNSLECLFARLTDEVSRPYPNLLISSLPSSLVHNEGLRARLKVLPQQSTYGSELPRRFQIET